MATVHGLLKDWKPQEGLKEPQKNFWVQNSKNYVGGGRGGRTSEIKSNLKVKVIGHIQSELVSDKASYEKPCFFKYVLNLLFSLTLSIPTSWLLCVA